MLDTFEQYYAIFVACGGGTACLHPTACTGQQNLTHLLPCHDMASSSSPCALVISSGKHSLRHCQRRAGTASSSKVASTSKKNCHTQSLAFDKTGTLTVGKPALNTIQTFGDTKKMTCSPRRHIGSAFEHHSGKSHHKAAQDRTFRPAPSSGRAIPGQGVEGVVENSHLGLVMNACLSDTALKSRPIFEQSKRNARTEGQTAMFAYRKQKNSSAFSA